MQTLPSDRLLQTNLINRTATVEVPASDSSNDETQVHFFNQTQRGQLKICKALGPGSSDLVGQTFYFDLTDVTDPSNPEPVLFKYPVSITAQASTQCVIVGNFPIGSTVAFTAIVPPGGAQSVAVVGACKLKSSMFRVRGSDADSGPLVMPTLNG